MKHSLAARAFRATVSLVAVAAWFHASNHCAIGEVLPNAQPATEHVSCHAQEAPVENEENGDCVDLSCCKSLATPTPTIAKNILGNDVSIPIEKDDLTLAIFSGGMEHEAPIAELDTGPPERNSFAESVLQRSLLAHAPPVA